VMAWLVVAVVVGVLVGRTIRQRDRQIPREDAGPAPKGIPAQGTEPEPGSSWSSRAVGRGRPHRP
jgi:hypothetical protein